MAFAPSTVLEQRREQMFPTLTPAQVDAVRRFGGEAQCYAPQEVAVQFGQVGAPAVLVLKGYLEVSRRDMVGTTETITRHEPGQMAGEISQLAGGPSFVQMIAGPEGCEAIPYDAAHLRSLMIGHAEAGEFLMRAFILRRVALIEAGAGTVLLGRADSADTVRLENFLRRNGVPYTFLDPEQDDQAKALIERLPTIKPEELPITVCPDGSTLRNPTEKALAQCIGLLPTFSQQNGYDVAIVGAGPAGLAAAVYAASEGLSVVVLDTRSFGGQAGASSRIENYLGFPTGISGMALAGRAFNQAQKFGATIAIPAEAMRLKCGMECTAGHKLHTPSAFGKPVSRRFEISLDDEQRVRASSIVVASGARYRRLDVSNLEMFEGHGIYYWASPIEAKLCVQQEIALVGGGNSAGQAAVFLASHAKKVHIIIRGKSLSATMSSYLIDRIKASPNIELHTQTELVELKGTREEGLQSILWRDRASGSTEDCPTRHCFVFIGADPNADWLRECFIAVDAKGFVQTGIEIAVADRQPEGHSQFTRAPLALETNIPGVFAIGDVRAGSVKRVASAVGEGAAVVAQLHNYLSQASTLPATAALAGDAHSADDEAVLVQPRNTASSSSTSTGLTR
ncbi:MAG: FAD-dependent oxidoreductase [Gammaproteobacteria bacterium]